MPSCELGAASQIRMGVDTYIYIYICIYIHAYVYVYIYEYICLRTNGQ